MTLIKGTPELFGFLLFLTYLLEMSPYFLSASSSLSPMLYKDRLIRTKSYRIELFKIDLLLVVLAGDTSSTRGYREIVVHSLVSLL